MALSPAGEVRARAALYAFILMTMLVGAVLLQGDGVTDASIHTLLEVTATFLALVIGVVSLVRYYSRKESLFLFIGAAFLGTGFLDAYHVLVTAEPITEGMAADRQSALAYWSWLASRFFLALFLFRRALVSRVRGSPRQMARVSETAVYGTAAVVAIAIFIAFSLYPLVEAYYPSFFFRRPFELVPGALFMVAALVNIRAGGWRDNAFEHWLVVSLFINFGVQAFFAAVSGDPFDAWHDAAHAFKLLGYACVFIGLLASVYYTYRHLEQSRVALADSNAALKQEAADREKTQDELRIRTAYLEQLFESAPEAIVVLDADDRVTRINSEFTRLFGYSPEEAIGATITDLIVPEHSRVEAAALSHAVASGEGVAWETVRRRKDGALVEVSILGTPIRGIGGHIAVYGIYRDITDRKRAEEERNETAARLKAIIEASPLAIVTVDEHGIVQSWNPAAERMLGWQSYQVLGRSLPLIDESQPDAPPLERALAGGEADSFEVARRRRDGSPVALSIATAPFVTSGGRSAGVMIVAADVTERRRAEEALRQAMAAAEAANRAKSDFLATVSHELRTPLNSVIGFTRILGKNKAGNLLPSDLTYMERIAANGEHLLSLINDVLDLSKIEARRMSVDFATVQLEVLIQETVAQLEGRTAGRDVELSARLPEHIAPIRTDGHKLRQILINLIGNSVKFTEQGSVTVAVAVDPDTHDPIRIDVADTGIGIPEDRLQRIFDAFEQADTSTARVYGGTGLGLSISRGLCELLGYRLDVSSRVGEGSTFSIVMAPEPAHRPAAERSATAGR